MSFELLDEHEQGEVVRKWLRENALSMATGVVVGLLLIFGWQQWKAHRANRVAESAAQYQALADAATARNDEDVQKIAASLRKEAPNGVYAILAALQQAEIASDKGDLATADETLEWASSRADMPAMKALVALRLARVKLAEGDADGAIKLLDGIKGDAFAGLAGEVRGDALARLGRADAARDAYAGALAHLEPQAPGRAVVQMKLDELPAANAPPAQAAAAPEKLGS